jgi:hypothetical protein
MQKAKLKKWGEEGPGPEINREIREIREAGGASRLKMQKAKLKIGEKRGGGH